MMDEGVLEWHVRNEVEISKISILLSVESNENECTREQMRACPFGPFGYPPLHGLSPPPVRRPIQGLPEVSPEG